MKMNFLKVINNNGTINQDVVNNITINGIGDLITFKEDNCWKIHNKIIDRNKECKEIDCLLNSSNKVIITALNGMGKTEIVKLYIDQFNKKYKKIHWLTFKVQNNIEQMILDNTFIPDIGYNDDNKVTIVMNYLNNLDSETLLVIDNLDGINIRENMENLFKLPCKIICTTQRRIKDFKYLTNVEFYTLPIISKEEGKLIFQAFYSQKITEEEFSIIYDLTKGHILAIKLLAKFAYSFDLNIENFIKLLKLNGFQLSVLDNQKLVNEGNIKRNFLNHIEKLYDISKNIKDYSKEEKIILSILAILPYNNISESLLKQYVDIKKGFNKTIESLYEKGWIDININNENKRSVSMHPLISEIMKRRIDISFETCKVMIGFFTSHRLDSSKNILQFRKIHLNNAIAVANYFIKSKKVDYEVMVKLTEKIAFSYYNMVYSNYDLAVLWFCFSFYFAKRSSSLEYEVKATYNLGNALEDRGNYETSISLLMRALLLSKIPKINKFDEGQIYLSLGVSYGKLNQKQYWKKQFEFYNKALKYYSKENSNSKNDLKEIEKCEGIAISKHDLASFYREQGNILKAIDYHKSSISLLNDNIDSISEDAKLRLTLCYNSYAQTLIKYYKNTNNQELLPQILECINQAFFIQKNNTNLDNPDVANIYLSYSDFYYLINNMSRALDYCLKSLEINLKILKYNHPTIIKNFKKLKNIYKIEKTNLDFNSWLDQKISNKEDIYYEHY